MNIFAFIVALFWSLFSGGGIYRNMTPIKGRAGASVYADVNSGVFAGTVTPGTTHTGGTGLAYTSGAPTWTWTTTTPMTYTMWIKLGGAQNCYYVLQGSNLLAGTGLMDYSCTGGTLQPEMRMQTYSTGAQTMSCRVTTGITDTNWHHVVGVNDGSNSNAACAGTKIYIDNVSKSLTQSGGSTSITTGTTTAGCPLYVGGLTNTNPCTTVTPGIYRLDGRMDMVSVYFGTALSASQVAELYCGTLGCSGSALLIDPRTASTSGSLTNFFGIGEGSDSSSFIFDLKGSDNLTNSSVTFSTPIPP